MLSYSMVLGCSGLLCWPDTRASSRVPFRAERARTWSGQRGVSRRHLAALAAPLAVVMAFDATGIVGACGCAVVLAAMWRQYTAHARARARLVQADHLAAALRTLVAELRSGAASEQAAESAAHEADADTAGVLRTVAAAARLGGDPAATLAGTRGRPADQIARCWVLAQQHGLPLAEVLDALRTDVEGRARIGANQRAAMAGPRASTVVLAALPVGGLALGESMGADPVHVLGTTSVGRMVLALGCGLTALGLLWSVRLTRSGEFG